MERLVFLIIAPFKVIYDLAELCVDATDGDNCWRLKTGAKLTREYYTSISQPLQVTRVREVKNKYKVNYISVVLTAITGAIRRIMEDAGQLVPERLAFGVPIPLHNHPGGLVNHVSSLSLKLPIKMRDPEKRLRYIYNRTNKSKYYMGPLATNVMTRMNYVNTNWLNSTVANNSVGFTVAVSSFPGPEEQFELLGCRVIDTMFGVGKIPGTAAATVAMVTAAGIQRFVMNIDKAVFPSQELFQNIGGYFENEIDILYNRKIDKNSKDYEC